MCGRYTLSATPARINTQFSVTIAPDWKPSYNIAPGTGRGPRPINARSEGVAGKPMFRNAFAKRRCILPADGFYEWKRLDRGKQPWLIRLHDGGVFGFAGIYEPGNEMTGDRPSCAILTTEANALMRPIHQRMPVILEPDDYADWLDPTRTEPSVLEKLLRPNESDGLVASPVSSRVNSVKNNDEDLIQPVNEA